MLSLEEDVEAQALREQGWSISAIARHLGRDRKTIRRYLSGERVPGQRKPAGQDPFEPFVEYCRLRLTDDPHLWASTLLDEIAGLGYAGGYSTFTRACAAISYGRTANPARSPAGRTETIDQTNQHDY
jgi:transposase